MVPELGISGCSWKAVAGHGCLGGIAGVNGACLVSQLSCSRPQYHSPGTALASSKEFKAHLKEAARPQTPAKFTSAERKAISRGYLIARGVTRQLAMDWTVEWWVLNCFSPRASPGFTSPDSVLWLNCSWTCASPGSTPISQLEQHITI